MKKIFILVFILLLSKYSFASELKVSQNFRYDTRGDEDYYITRVQLDSEYPLEKFNRKLKFSPFIEARYHLDWDKVYRAEVGIEAGVDIFDWFYFGESLQFASLDPGKDRAEAETILVFSYPLKIDILKSKLYAFEEHTFNLSAGQGTRNEVGGGISVKINDYIEALLGWRHVDRIHDFDSDQVETQITVTF